MHRDVGDQLVRRVYYPHALVVIAAPVRGEHQAMLVVPELAQIGGIPRSEDRARAGNAENIPYGSGVDVRVAELEVQGIAGLIKGDTVAKSDDRHLPAGQERIAVGPPRRVEMISVRCGHIHRRQHVILAAEIRVLISQADAQPSRLRAAAVVPCDAVFFGFLVDHAQHCVHRGLFLPAAQEHLRLLRGIFVGDAEIAGDLVDVGRLARDDRGRARADVGLVEEFVALYDQPPDLRFYDLKTDLAALELLFRQDHLHGAPAGFAVGALHHFERPLHVGKRAPRTGQLPGIGFELLARNERSALENEAPDFETRRVVGGGLLRSLRECGRSEKCREN